MADADIDDLSSHLSVNPIDTSNRNTEQSNVNWLDLPYSTIESHGNGVDSRTTFSPSTLSWKNLNVHSNPSSGLAKLLGRAKDSVHIIKDVSGYIEPGNTLAILGASGAGKTTLLNVLTGQNLRNVTIKGQVLLNNEPTTLERLSRCSSYVQQDDLFYGSLTVREHLTFQLQLRSRKVLTKQQIDTKVDQLLTRLSLMKVSESRICCDKTGQRLSGGERKRLSIASEILTDPAILFCDEPTTGIDSYMTLSVVSALKSLAEEQRTVICTIHQPSSEVFNLFDQIMLLAEGRLVFLGKTSQALEFFTQVGLSCPSNYNPPDFFIQQLSILPGNEDQCRAKVQMIADKYETSDYHIELKKQIRPEEAGYEAQRTTDTSQRTIDLMAHEPKQSSLYRRGIWTQFRLLMWRMTLINIRDPMLAAARIVNTLFSVLLVVLVYWRQNYDQEGVMNINGAIFMLIANANFSSIFVVINTFCPETPLFLREHANGLYRVSVYYMAKTVAELPYFVVLPIFYWSVSYYAIGFYNSIDSFLLGNLVCVMVVNAASGFGYFCSAISKTVTIGLELANPLIAPLILLGGTFLNPASIPKWIAWIRYFSWFYYANEILTVNQWRDVTNITCDYELPIDISFLEGLNLPTNVTFPGGQGCLVNGKQVLASIGFKESNVVFDYWMLSATIVGFRAAAFIALLIRAKNQ